MHGKKQPPHRPGQRAKEVLPHKYRAVVQFSRQVQAFADNGAHHAPRLQQTAEKGQHRVKVALVVQIAPGQQQIAEAGAIGIKIAGHAGEKKIQVQAQGVGKNSGHAFPDPVPCPAHARKLPSEKIRRGFFA